MVSDDRGALDDALWADAARFDLTQSMATSTCAWAAPRGRRGAAAHPVKSAARTTVLYVAARLPDRDIRGTYEQHDDELWKEASPFEVFVFGVRIRNKYLELQVSPRGVTFDKRFTSHRKGDQASSARRAHHVEVDGTIERKGGRDRGWTVEAGIEWAEICEHTETTCPPAPHSVGVGSTLLGSRRSSANADTVAHAPRPTSVCGSTRRRTRARCNCYRARRRRAHGADPVYAAGAAHRGARARDRGDPLKVC